MSEKFLKTRIQLKTGTSSYWKEIENNFIPLLGEIIIYDNLDGKNPKAKVGTGITLLKELPFISCSLKDLGIQASNLELNFCQGLQENIQTQLNNKIEEINYIVTIPVEFFKEGIIPQTIEIEKDSFGKTLSLLKEDQDGFVDIKLPDNPTIEQLSDIEELLDNWNLIDKIIIKNKKIEVSCYREIPTKTLQIKLKAINKN